MSEVTMEQKKKCDNFAVFPSIRSYEKRRLLRNRPDGQKRQCWELTTDEILNLYIALSRHIDPKVRAKLNTSKTPRKSPRRKKSDVPIE